MGFFSDLKEDLSQVVSELMPTSAPEEPAAEEPVSSEADLTVQNVSLEEMLENIDDVQVPDFTEEVETAAEFEETEEEGGLEFISGEPEFEAEIGETEAETAEFEAASEEIEAEMAEAAEELEAEAAEMEAETAEEPAAEAEEEFVAEPVAAAEALWAAVAGLEAASEEAEAEPEAAEEPAAEAEEFAEEPAAEADEPEEAAAPESEVLAEISEEEIAIEEQNITESKGAEKEMDNHMGKEAVDETAVITAGMQITGDIISEGSIDIIGSVNGNIDILGKLNITGHINGNSKAAEIYAEGAKINGEVVSEGAVKIGVSSVIIGNITATSAAIAGAVKGDIDVKGPVILDASAIVMGNIKSKSVQINNGAVIEGMCSQCYADVSPTSFFDDYKPDEKASKKSK